MSAGTDNTAELHVLSPERSAASLSRTIKSAPVIKCSLVFVFFSAPVAQRVSILQENEQQQFF